MPAEKSIKHFDHFGGKNLSRFTIFKDLLNNPEYIITPFLNCKPNQSEG
jgi:hypothetical protein